MKEILILLFALFSLDALGQNDLPDQAQKNVREGKLLYQYEMASWYGTDLFIENYEDHKNIGGYFSYLDNDTPKCVFYSNKEYPQVIGTISFDGTYDIHTAQIDLRERNFTERESEFHKIRTAVMKELNTNADGFFKFYENTRPNVIPLITESERKAYVLTGPQKSGIVIFGNDYLLTFDKENNMVHKKRLHQNLIPIEYGNLPDDSEVLMTMHNHSPETGDFITATDICTLMLYEKFTNWKSHNVVSKKYLNIWDCENHRLNLLPMKTVKKIQKDQERRQRRK